MRSGLAILAAAAAALAAPAAAEAQRFKPCRGKDGVECATVRVPLDRSGRTPGTVSLRVERIRALGRRRGLLIALAGGPGQAASPFSVEFALELLPGLLTRDLIVYDQRGTGESGLLRCRSLERANILDARDEAAACANQLGARRGFYTTQDSVEDIEAIRRSQRREKITLYGVSYGTKVALAYAQRYPQHVERLVLDSVVEPGGPDPFYSNAFVALPRVLRALCGGNRCRRITPDPVADVAELARRLSGAPLPGYVVNARGRRQRAALDSFGLFGLALSGDLDPSLRADLPGAVRAALNGDPAPILRLVKRAQQTEDEGSPKLLSSALYAATTCEESPLPWDRGAPFEARPRQARERAASMPDSAFFPLDRETALASDVLRLCERWPNAAPAPPAFGALPDVPILMLEGRDDLRTPVESALQLKQRRSSAQLLKVSNVGHSVLGSDFSVCSQRALERFFRNRDAGGNCRGERVFDPSPIPPRRLADVRRARGYGGRRGRTLSAVGLTIADVTALTLTAPSDPENPEAPVRGGGLRGGTFQLVFRGATSVPELDLGELTEEEIEQELDELAESLRIDIVLKDMEFVPGVRVTGTLRNTAERTRGSLKVSGGSAARGRLAVRGDADGFTFSGRLDGRRVRVRSTAATQVVQARSQKAAKVAQLLSDHP